MMNGVRRRPLLMVSCAPRQHQRYGDGPLSQLSVLIAQPSQFPDSRFAHAAKLALPCVKRARCNSKRTADLRHVFSAMPGVLEDRCNFGVGIVFAAARSAASFVRGRGGKAARRN